MYRKKLKTEHGEHLQIQLVRGTEWRIISWPAQAKKISEILSEKQAGCGGTCL
jgi:hypothetical protein